MGGHQRSFVWNHFNKDDDENVTCNYCSRSFRLFNGSTSNLRKHFNKWHGKLSNLNSKRKVPEPARNLTLPKRSSLLRSLIWNHFRKVDYRSATCGYCRSTIRFSGGSSANLRRHLIKKHGLNDLSNKQNGIETTELTEPTEFISVLVECDEGQQTTILKETETSDEPVVFEYIDSSTDNLRAKTSSSGNSKKRVLQVSLGDSKGAECIQKKEIDDNLLMFIVHDFQPFSIVEEISFKQFCHSLNPSYTLPDRTTLVEHLLPNKYSKIENYTKELVSNAQSFIITTELWTSIDNENVMAVRAHFVDHNCDTKSSLLEVCTFSETCTSSDLVNDLQRVLYKWNLNEKILLVISDGTKSIRNAIIEELQFSHFDCLAYSINTIANDGLALIKPLINKVKSVVSLFTRNSLASGKLEALQEQNGKTPKKLIQSVSNQWNSVFYMFERILELKEEIITSVDEHDNLTGEEFEEIKQLVSVLSPMDSATKSMCERIHNTLSSVIIITNGLQEVYSRLCEEKTKFSSQVKTVVQTIGQKVFENFRDIEDNSILLVSTMLDPRFKNVGFSNKHVKEKARNLLTDLLTNYIDQTSSSTRKIDPLSSEPNGEKDSEYSVWNFFAKKASQIEPVEPTATNQSRASIEIQQYLEEPILNRQEIPLIWWRTNESVYPYLSKLVYTKFGVVCTSVTCEQLFSINGQVLLKRRNQLPAEDIRQILFLRENSE